MFNNQKLHNYLIITIPALFVMSTPSYGIDLTYDMTGVINNTNVDFDFSGIGNENDGSYQGQAQFSAQPPNWDLTASIITISGSSNSMFLGLSDYSFGLGTNMLELTGGNFEISRTTTYTNQTSMETIGVMDFVGESTRNNSDLITITGDIDASGDWSGVSDVVSVLPFEMNWFPFGTGQIRTTANITYVTSDNLQINGFMDSIYTFDPSISLPFNQVSSNLFNITETETLTFDIEFNGESWRTPIPEPSSLAFIGLSILSIPILKRKQKV